MKFWRKVITTDIIRDNPAAEQSESSSPQYAERMALLVNGIRDYAILMLDIDGRVATWNDGAERIKGYRANEIIGEHFSKFYPPEDVARGKPALELRIAAEQGRFEEEGWRIRKDGSRFWARVVVTALHDSSGRLQGFGKVMRDNTDQKLFEQSLQEKNLELANANQAKDLFLATMSHELRTPLNAIIGFTGTLLMRLPGPLTENQEKQLRTVQSSGKHLLSLINDILDLAKIESGKVQLKLESIVCNAVLEEVATTLRPLAESKGLKLETIVSGSNIVALTDKRALNQILLNLTSNAIKYTEKGNVCVELTQSKSDGSTMTQFGVLDTGIGISPDDQEKLFQPFARVVNGKTERVSGTGLGLHLSRKLAELLGGDITAQSQPGKGSKFSLVLLQTDNGGGNERSRSGD